MKRSPTTRRRVLFVTHRADLTGAPRCILELVEGLDSSRYHCEVAVEEDGPLCSHFAERTKKLHHLPKSKARGLAGWFHAYRVLREAQPDVLHVNRAVAFSKTFAMVARLLGIPVLWHLHDEFQGRMKRRLPWVKRLSTRVVSCSQRVSETPGLGDVTVIPNGSQFSARDPEEDLERRARALGVEPVSFRFLFVGSIIPRKNVRMIVEAAAKVLEEWPDTHFLAVGDSDSPEYMAQVHADMERLNLGERFQLLPSQSDVAPFYAMSDVLLLPSKSEAFPLVVLEAASFGLATVATAVGDVPELLADNSGWLLEHYEFDQDHLCDVLKEIRHGGREAARQRGARAREHIGGRYSLDRYLRDFDHVYGEMLG